MIFKENNTSTTELVLPPITTTKPESPAEVKPNEEEKHKEENDENKEVSSLKINSIKNQEPNTKSQSISQNLVNHNLTMDTIKNENNRYKLQDNQTIQEENSKTEVEEQNKKPEEKEENKEEEDILIPSYNPEKITSLPELETKKKNKKKLMKFKG